MTGATQRPVVRNRRAFLARASQATIGLTMAARVGPARPAERSGFVFGLIGDTPYNELDAQRLRDLFAAIDPEVQFLIHVGDIKASSERCDDQLLDARHRLLDASPLPLVYTPGDNEWTDCSQRMGGRFAPVERLERLRTLFFPQPRSLGRKTIPLQRQSDLMPAHRFAEHVRWQVGDVLFLTLNMPGGLRPDRWSAPLRLFHEQRQAAAFAWLTAGIEQATRDRLGALVVVAHVDPHFQRDAPGLFGSTTDNARPDPHRALRRELAAASNRWAGPMLFLHGDTHFFRQDRPLHDALGRRAERFLRVESFGAPFTSSWVRITYQPAQAEPFFVATRHL